MQNVIKFLITSYLKSKLVDYLKNMNSYINTDLI